MTCIYAVKYNVSKNNLEHGNPKNAIIRSR